MGRLSIEVYTQHIFKEQRQFGIYFNYEHFVLIFFFSLPLSYLLHTRHTGGFSSFMDAALMGRSGANCTELYKSCPRLSY